MPVATGDHRNDAYHEVAQHLHIGLDRAVGPAQFGIVRLADDQVVILARKAHGPATLIHDGLHDAFVDEAGQDHLHHVDSGLVGHALAAHEGRSDAELAQHLVDHRPAAMHDHRVDPDLPHEHDVAGELGHGLRVAHRVSAELHHHDRARIALHVRKRLGQGAGGGVPVSVHVLGLHLWIREGVGPAVIGP